MPTNNPQNASHTRMKKVRIHEMIVTKLGKGIVAGEYEAGISLGNETKIGETFKASRTSTREALKILESKGLIESTPKIGTVVRPTKDWNLMDPVVLKWCLQDQSQSATTMMNLHEIRMAFEPFAASLAAVNHTDEDMLAMRRALRGMAHYVDNNDRVEYDLEFHKAILRATGNALYLSLGELISVGLLHLFQANFEATSEEDERWLKRHREVADAIESRDVENSKKQMQNLLVQALDIADLPDLRTSQSLKEQHENRL